MVAAGVIAAVILSGIAVVVAAVFQTTSSWLMPCPRDLPVNDPAPILWKDVVGKTDKPAPLGGPAALAKQASWKGTPAASK